MNELYDTGAKRVEDLDFLASAARLYRWCAYAKPRLGCLLSDLFGVCLGEHVDLREAFGCIYAVAQAIVHPSAYEAIFSPCLTVD